MRPNYCLLLLVSLLYFTHFTHAQGIEIDAVNPVTSTTVGETDTLQLTVSNYLTVDTVAVDLVALCMDCTLSEQAVVVPAGEVAQVALYFTPRHNIDYPVYVFAVPQNGLGTDAAGALVSVDLKEAYYSSTQNLWEEDLKQELKKIISSPYVNKGYNGARDEMYMQIDNQRVNGQGATTNTLECVYTGTTITGYTSRSAAQNQGFNTEHTYPQGTFNSNEPMRADLHHLFPTTVSSNSERANKPFGIVNNPSWQVGGSKSNSTTFEPRDKQKGPAARAMLYFLVRYQNYQGYVGAADQTVLKNWTLQYPPSTAEQNRNDAIQAVQRNRNPFTDYPQWVERISNFRSNSGTYEKVSCVALPDTLYVTGTDQVSGFSRPLAVGNDGTAPYTLSVITRDFSGGAVATIQTGRLNNELLPGEVGMVDLSFGVGQLSDTGYVDIINSLSPAEPTTIVVIAQPGPLVDPTAIAPMHTSGVTLYPNPVADVLRWQAPEAIKMDRYVVTNTLGQVVYTGSLTNEQQVSTTALSAGYYCLQLYPANQAAPVVLPFIKRQ